MLAPKETTGPTAMDRSIMLVGMPGAGKSTVGSILAQQLGLALRDTDTLIEAEATLGIAEIFRLRGQDWFRKIERLLIADLLCGPPAVITAGGGAFLEATTRLEALQRAVVVWLDADLTTLGRRLDGSGRPLLTGDVTTRIATMKVERDPLYALAHVRIDASAGPKAVAEAVLARLSSPSGTGQFQARSATR